MATEVEVEIPSSPASGVASTPAAMPEPTASPTASAAPASVPVEAAPAAPAATPPLEPAAPAAEPAKELAKEPAKEPVKEADKPAETPKSLLGEALAEGAKPAEAAKPDGVTEAKPGEEAAKVVTAPGEPIKWDYTIPDTVKLDDAGKTRVNSLLDQFAADPRKKENVQALVDYHAEQMGKVKDEVDKSNRQYWNDLRSQKREAIKSDPQLGGSGFVTTSATVRRMIDMATSGWSSDQKRELETDIETTGMGDFPSLWRLLKSFAKFYDEPGMPPSNPIPPPDRGRAPGRGRLRDFYGSK